MGDLAACVRPHRAYPSGFCAVPECCLHRSLTEDGRGSASCGRMEVELGGLTTRLLPYYIHDELSGFHPSLGLSSD